MVRREAGDAVGEPERRQRRRPVGLAGLMCEPAHRLGQRPERTALRIRAELAEAGHPQHDESGVELVQPVGAQVPLLHHPRAEVLDQDVGLGDEPLEQLAALRPAQVERDRALVARDHLPPQAMAVLVVAVGARRVAARVLDLYHVRAVVAEQHRGDRRGVDRPEVEHADPVERSGRGRVGAGCVCVVRGGGHEGFRVQSSSPNVSRPAVAGRPRRRARRVGT